MEEEDILGCGGQQAVERGAAATFSEISQKRGNLQIKTKLEAKSSQTAGLAKEESGCAVMTPPTAMRFRAFPMILIIWAARRRSPARRGVESVKQNQRQGARKCPASDLRIEALLRLS